MLIDLQIHSNYSDGYLTPTQVVEFLAQQKVKIAALTDHNTVAGLDEFRQACRQFKIKPITGLELYVKFRHRHFNLLWYNFNDTDPELHDLLRQSQIRRRRNVRAVLQKLIRKGFVLNVDLMLDKYTHYVPINRVVDEIWQNAKNRHRIIQLLKIQRPREEEIIAAFLKSKQFVALRESYIDITRILRLRQKIGGQLIWNHPAKYDYIKRSFFAQVKQLGVDGIELLSPHHSWGAVSYLQQIAQEFDFITTGGSDFHKFDKGKVKLTHSWQYYKIDSQYLRGINKIII
ncbi:PHP domain-containing protein [Candidatus Parcubacteria bacterium]|nr:MAG: PHP domain-containing protein [Candidatus Parcubacteria bacterium]